MYARFVSFSSSKLWIKSIFNRQPPTCRTQEQRPRHTIPARDTGITLSSMCNCHICPWITGHRLNSSPRAVVTLRTRPPCNSISRGGCDGSLYTVIPALETLEKESSETKIYEVMNTKRCLGSICSIFIRVWYTLHCRVHEV